jgi:hypothetical protein
MSKKERQFICDDHEDILHYARELRNLIIDNVDDSTKREEMLRALSNLKETVKDARYSGIRMEKRLEHYREAIEYLGFVRDKNKNPS